MRYDYYLFDFDGTIADTGEGIRRSVAYSLEKLGRPVPEVGVLNRFIGPPLYDSYMEQCGMTGPEAERAIQVYRERYVDTGLYESFVYPGIAPLLKALKARGAYVALASAKPQFMLERLSEHFGIAGWIDAICGTGPERHSADKRDLLLGALPRGADPRRALMVGDRKYDIEAAKALGMAAVGAGYGYAPEGELAAAGAECVLESPAALSRQLLEGDVPRGLFIALEGSDICGKATQIARLRDHLSRRGYAVLLTREPGGCPVSERIREILLSPDSKGMSAECGALLYAASRVEHVREVIEPALKCGEIVICDRILDPGIACQACGREPGEAFIRQINALAAKAAQPDAILLLEADRSRAKRRTAAAAPLERIVSIDVGGSVDEVFEKVKAAVDAALLRPRGPADKGV